MIDNIGDLMALAEDYTRYLEAAGMSFDANGFPLIDRGCFLSEWPDEIITYQYRNNRLVTDSRKTVLCHFAPDSRIYPRLEKLYEEVDVYLGYMGVVMFDVTVTYDMSLEWQDFIMLLNQLATAVLAVNGVPIMPNMRIGSPDSVYNLSSFPEGLLWATGTLGCAKTTDEADASFLAKALALRPRGVALYGKSDPIIEEQLERFGIEVRVYPDVHKRYKQPK